MADYETTHPVGLLPKGAVAWDQLLDPPLRFGPWPYTDAEIDDIRKTLPAATADGAVKEALFAARWFLARMRLKERRKEPPKPDPHAELLRIRDAVAALKGAIKGASPQATQHLIERPSPGAANPPIRPLDLLNVIEHFEHDNRFAFRALPERDMIGAPEKLSEEALVYRLWLAWKQAHAARLPKDGWPAFRAACVNPLLSARFPKELRPARRDERGWQTLLARARSRREGERKSAK